MQQLINRYNTGSICLTMLKAYVILANMEADTHTYILSFNSAMQPVIEVE